MYLDRSIEDDNVLVENWKRNTDGVLIFVSNQVTIHTSAYILEFVDGSVLCRCRSIPRSFCIECSAESTRHLIILPRSCLSTTLHPTKWIPTFYPVELGQPHRAIRSTNIGRLGQRAVVLESRLVISLTCALVALLLEQ